MKRPKLLFIHIPKNAGMTVKRVLAGGIHHGHKRLTEYPKTMRSKCLTICVVRNPWERLISWYFYCLGMNASLCPWAKEYSNFKDFCLNVESHPKFFRPQTWWTKDEDNEVNIDLVIRHENFRQDMKKILNLVKIPHLNKSKHEVYTEYYDNETIAMVEKVYQDDIRAFGYSYPKRIFMI